MFFSPPVAGLIHSANPEQSREEFSRTDLAGPDGLAISRLYEVQTQ
jgi:hypothetical protein